MNTSDIRDVRFQKTNELQFFHIGMLREYLALDLTLNMEGKVKVNEINLLQLITYVDGRGAWNNSDSQ